MKEGTSSNNREIEVFQNRELSHLEFYKRVLLKAADAQVPLLERLKFLSIFYDSIEEFFMTRVSLLYYDKLNNRKKYDVITGLTPKEQIHLVCEKVKNLFERGDRLYFELIDILRQKYLDYVSIDLLDDGERGYIEQFFYKNIFPLVSPQIIDKHHPFPFLRNKGVYVYVKLIDKKKQSTKIGIIPVPSYFNQIIFLREDNGESRKKFLLLEDVILYFASSLFKKYRIVSKTLFKVTRKMEENIDEIVEDKSGDMKQIMSDLLRQRRSLAPVKLEIKKCKDVEYISDYLRDKLSIEKKQVFITKTPLHISFLSKVIKLFDEYDYADLFYPKMQPKKPRNIMNMSMIDEVMDHDILLSYPFESMALFSKLLDQAAEDPRVVSIKITLYRVAANSQIISILKKAADNGKDVLVIVELKAKFDEQNNIDWATALEESGCKVIYGLQGYKIHAKVLLITKKDGNKINYISQIGTGNYNEITAKSYTDLSYMTSNEEIGKDILDLFNNVCVGNLQEKTNLILSAPLIFKPRFIELISDEIAKAKKGIPARIVIKCNALTDKDIMMKLIEASRAGVEIKLIIRGICCLLPGVEGYTDNIEVISIIGRYLEHSRIFLFGAGEEQKVFISSADLMVRNTCSRVEVVCPIYDSVVKQKIISLLEIYLSDNILATRLMKDGSYQKVYPKDNEGYLSSQEQLYHI